MLLADRSIALDISAMPTTYPNVHFLDFNEGNSPIDDPERFNILWQISTDQPPQPQHKLSSESSSSEEWNGIFEGDLVVFPSLLSGAGEFEAVRFVGPTITSLVDGKDEILLPLLTAGVEMPEFPILIVQLAEERGFSLREMYEEPFNAILQYQPPKITLFDLYSRDEVAYSSFWEDVPVARRRRPPSSNPWKFSLGDCIWIYTLTGESLGVKDGDEL